MIRGSTKIFLETLAGIVVAALLFAGFAVWRLGTGPISIDDITPYIETALSDEASGRRVIIGASSLAWDATDHAIEVRADRVTVFDGDGLAVMVVPEMAVRFSLSALLRGVFVPRAISLVRPTIMVVRTAEGVWEFSAVPESDPGTDPGAAPRPGDGVAVASQLQQSLAPLDRFRLIDARVVIDDRRAQAQWVLPRVSAAARRVAGLIAADASIVLEVDDAQVPARASARFGADFELLEGDLTVADLVPARLARRVKALAPLAALDLPLGGTFHLAGRADRDKPALDFKVTGGAGQIVRPELAGGALPVVSLGFAGRYVVAGERLTIATLTLGVPGATLTASGAVNDLLGNATLEGMAAMPSLPVDDLRKYWPPGASANARKWIAANLSQGTARDITARVVGKRVNGVVEISSAEGQMTFEGARVRYLPPQPQVEQITGTLRFTHRQIDIAVKSARLRGLRIESGQITITGLEERDEIMTLEAVAQGPVTDTLTLLDLPPFGYVRRFGATPESIGGEHSARLKLRFPLIDRLTLDDIELEATASLTGVRIPKVVREFDLTDGKLELKLDKASMTMSGEAQIGGVPSTVAWLEHFVRNPPFRRRYDAAATVTEAQRRKLGLDVGDTLAGTTEVVLRYVEQPDRRAKLTGALDLRAATLKIPDLAWRKAAGEAANAQFEASVIDGKLATLDAATLDGGGLRVRAGGAFGDAGRLTRVDVREFKLGETDVAARVTWPGERLDVAVTGRSLDATTLLGPDDPNGKPPRAMTVSAKLDRVVVGPGREVGRVDLRADSDGARWRAASLSGAVGAGTMTLELVPRNGRRELTLISDDAGAVLKTFGLTDHMEGGRLRVDGRYDDSGPTDKLIAQLTAEEFRLVRAPMMAKLLAVTSITGIPEVMSGDGLAFQELSMQLVRQPNRIEITDAKASGLAIGLTAQGTIQGVDDVADLTGTIVPFHSVNRLFSAIPLIGDLVTGGGGGLFAFTYRVAGPIENPSVSVNPLSVLAPGFVRNLFHWLPGVGGGGGATPPPVSNQQ